MFFFSGTSGDNCEYDISTVAETTNVVEVTTYVEVTTDYSISTASDLEDCNATDSCDGHYTCDNATNEKICMSGWTGDSCADRNITAGSSDSECPSAVRTTGCRNGGTCWSQSCCCVTGYEGNLCQIETLECESSPCGSGTCLDYIGYYVCVCPDGKSLETILLIYYI